jgi:hypothetical protein
MASRNHEVVSFHLDRIGRALISDFADPEPYGEDPVKGIVFGMMAAFFQRFWTRLKQRMEFLRFYVRIGTDWEVIRCASSMGFQLTSSA